MVVGLDVVDVVEAHVGVHERRAHLEQALRVALELVLGARQQPRDPAGLLHALEGVEERARLPVECRDALGAEHDMRVRGLCVGRWHEGRHKTPSREGGAQETPRISLLKGLCLLATFTPCVGVDPE